MKPPKFWQINPPNWQSRALLPLSKIWQWKTRQRVSRAGERAQLPVISIGNINLGGTGKTPTTIYLALALQEAGYEPVIILRGYKGREKNTVWVENQNAQDVGDEALLLAQFAPVIVSRDRAAGARVAPQKGNVILLDDALQNPSLEKDISICVMDGETGLGNGSVFPSGPLRETLEDAWPRIDATLMIGNENPQLASKISTKPHFHGALCPLEMGMNWQDKKLIAFAGIARPQKFFNTLRGLGAELVSTHEFDDHATISETVLERMHREAKAAGASLITTEKDAVRLPHSWQGKIFSLPVRLEMRNGDLAEWVITRLKSL